MSKQRAQASTQKFTQVQDIINDIVMLNSGNAFIVIEVSPANFALLSVDEQEAKIGAYAAFLNSLTFPIQIVVNNRRVNITSYIQLLNDEINKLQDPIVMQYMEMYKTFITQLVKENIVLDKRFYIVVPYSYLEVGAIKSMSQTGQKSEAIVGIRATLHSKSDSIRNQLSRLNLQTRVLEKVELIKLLHQMYNPESSDAAVPNSINKTTAMSEDKVKS